LFQKSQVKKHESLFAMWHNEEGIKEVKKERFRSTIVRLPTLFIKSSTVCLTFKALLFILLILLLSAVIHL